MMEERNHETTGQAMGASEPKAQHDAVAPEDPSLMGATGTDATAPGAPYGAALGGRRLRKHRFGVCHRCGWTRLVSKVRREDYPRIGVGRAFGRLCDDCFADLLGAASTQGATATALDEVGAATASNSGIPRQLAGAGLSGGPPRSAITGGHAFA
jgi:hypothetical protein